MVTEITKFYADDGVAFDTRSEAVEYEFHQTAKAELRYLDYIGRSYSGTQVVKEHGLAKYGTWEIKGEDANADFGGHHYQPSLGLYQGTLEQVIRKAVSLPSFYTWGGGGNIILRNPPEVLSL